MNKHLLSTYCVPSPGSSRGVGTGIGKPQLCLLRRLVFQCQLSHNPRVLHTRETSVIQLLLAVSPHGLVPTNMVSTLQRRDVSSHAGW